MTEIADDSLIRTTLNDIIARVYQITRRRVNERLRTHTHTHTSCMPLNVLRTSTSVCPSVTSAVESKFHCYRIININQEAHKPVRRV